MAEVAGDRRGRPRPAARSTGPASRSIFFYSDSHILGGAERALIMLCQALDPAAWRPTLLLDDAPDVEEIRTLAIGIGLPVRLVRPLPLGGAGARGVPGFVRMLRGDPPAVFHAHLSSPLAAKYALAGAVLARIPAVLATVHLVPHFELDGSSHRQLRALARGVGAYVAVSRDVARQLVTRFGYPPRKVEVVYNSVDRRRFAAAAPPGLRAQLTGPHGWPVVLTCARLTEQKGLDVLLRAAAGLPAVRFVIAGQGPLREALRAQAKTLGIDDRVLLLGARDDVPALLAASDVVALPSRYEGTSLAVLEAMAAGRPVVTSAIAGTDELIAGEVSGLLVPADDHLALTAALARVLADGELRRRLAARALERVEREFTPDRMAGRTAAIYEQLLAGA